ncbi:sulfur stress regulator [Micractinium conductrix]|uniref:Sulfur stress regulator n=1 Tax=Micractinium conductrix TaxID=554055 RepID=A0A2P6UZA2_9CHLO|nr:sulfur stress regulator [Micractinium conductrix]|eukprot:PSC67166.1 sulfur stress regulator [Micractinium conductrix]
MSSQQLDEYESVAQALESATGGRYRALAPLSRGAFGLVVRAACGDREVAVKALKLTINDSLKDVSREIMHHQRLLHAHVVRFKECFAAPPYLCIAMELVAGGDLLELVNEARGLPEDEARYLFQQLILAVDYCHRLGIMSRDIKPENTLLVRVPGKPPMVKLCDFGYAKSLEDSAPTTRAGTMHYVAPEVMLNVHRSAYDGMKADVWSCGVLLYVMLFCAFPFSLAGDGAAGGEAAQMHLVGRRWWARFSVEDIKRHPWFLRNLLPGTLDYNEKVLALPRVLPQSEAEVRAAIEKSMAAVQASRSTGEGYSTLESDSGSEGGVGNMLDPLRGAAPHPLQVRPSAPLAINNKLEALAHDSEGEGLSPLGSDIEDGPRRLVEDPDSPTSRLLERAARRSLASSAQATPERFSYLKDIARNPELARAARRALSASPQQAGQASGGGGMLHAAPRGGGPPPPAVAPQHLQLGQELDTLTAVVDHLDSDAAEESRINQDMAGLTLGRLQSGRAAAERTLGVLQAFAAAETAYARAMTAVARLSLVGGSDGASLRAAMEQVSELPSLMGLSHSSVAERLSEAIKGLQALVQELRLACDEVVHGAGRAKREVEASRHALKAALRGHQESVAAFAVAAAARARPAARGRGVDSDPWLTEGCLVEQQVRLQRAQHVERQYLAKAFQRVGDLERRRAEVVQTTLHSFVHIYRSQVVPLQEIADELQQLLDQIDAASDLESFTETAASSVQSADVLSSRQREAVDQLCSELLGSAEIVRQGRMERWNSSSGKWRQGHLVLTRAGFLHFFLPESAAAKAAALSHGGPSAANGSSSGVGADGGAAGEGGGGGGGAPSGGGSAASLPSVPSGGQLPWGGADSWTAPLESLNLSRCSFEEGDAPVFRIIEAAAGGLGGFALFSGRPRTQMLRAASVEYCMDWAIAIREAIASCTP